MQKPNKYDWKDSNVALFGSDLDKKVKKESAQGEPAWQGAGQAPGTKVWRIEKFQVVDWPQQQYGQFFDGDSYIILNTYKQNDTLAYDVHFWIGKYSSQDEYGTAAYKTVELDTFLDDVPVQHREVQGYETTLFGSYFPALSILKGGVDSGFRHVVPTEAQPKLFHVKKQGRTLTVKEVAVSPDSLRADDAFVLDLGDTIFAWGGPQCSADEKFKATSAAAELASKSNRNANVETLDADIPAEHRFFVAIGGQPGELKPSVVKEPLNREKVLFKVSDADGSLDMDEVARGNVSKDLLKSEDVFVYDAGNHIFVWVGASASIDERKNGFAYATKYLSGTDVPYLPITVLSEGANNAAFDASF